MLLQEVDEGAFVVRLECHEVTSGLARDLPTTHLDLFECRPTVDLWIARSEEVQIRSIHEEELHAASSTTRAAGRGAASPTPVTSLKRPMRLGKIHRTFPAPAFFAPGP